jgi:hypothetical protein
MLAEEPSRCPVPGNGIMDYAFINVKKPRDALKLAKAREFRSHVTRQQWKRSGPRKKALLTTKEKGARDQIDTDSSSEVDLICISPAIGGLRVDPFQSYPIPGRLWISLLVDHCKLFGYRGIRSNEKGNLTIITRLGPHGR